MSSLKPHNRRDHWLARGEFYHYIVCSMFLIVASVSFNSYWTPAGILIQEFYHSDRNSQKSHTSRRALEANTHIYTVHRHTDPYTKRYMNHDIAVAHCSSHILWCSAHTGPHTLCCSCKVHHWCSAWPIHIHNKYTYTYTVLQMHTLHKPGEKNDKGAKNKWLIGAAGLK